MRVAGFGNAALHALGSARVFGRDQADEGHRAGRGGKAMRVAEFGRDGQGGEIINAAEAPQALHPRAQRLQIEQRQEIGFDGAKPGQDFIDGSEIGTVRLLERGQRPRLRSQPRVVALGPRLLRPGEAAAVAEQEFREPVPGAQEIRADVFTNTGADRAPLLPARWECESRSVRRLDTAQPGVRHRGDLS